MISLVVGLVFMIRYTLQMKDHLLEIREEHHQGFCAPGEPAVTSTVAQVPETGYNEEFFSDLVVNESTSLVTEPTIPMV